MRASFVPELWKKPISRRLDNATHDRPTLGFSVITGVAVLEMRRSAWLNADHDCAARTIARDLAIF
ncbi:hypothetical protein [Mesorhizobium sp. M0140]|uniref:hypothetical protein n=1 Tax=Mesorhizobium sp. M0140 TaxID=2956893 RepID=UPI00333D6D74